MKLGNLQGGKQEKNLYLLQNEKKKSFLYYSKGIGSPRMLKPGEAENFWGKKKGHRNARVADFKNTAIKFLILNISFV